MEIDFAIWHLQSKKVKTGGSTQSSDYYETKTMVAWKTYWASVDSTV